MTAAQAELLISTIYALLFTGSGDVIGLVGLLTGRVTEPFVSRN